MDSIIIEQLKELHKLYPNLEERQQLEQWEKELKHSSLFINLKEHAAFKIICDKYYLELTKINEQLKTDVALFMGPEGLILGRLLHERKRFIQEFFRPFELAKVEDANARDNISRKLKALTADPEYTKDWTPAP